MVFKGAFEAHFGLIFELKLELLYLEDAFGVNHLFLLFHE
jgi:hypothetical protein